LQYYFHGVSFTMLSESESALNVDYF
jgi:hypothetical protein